MESLDFSEAVQLLNCSHSITINAQPVESLAGNWDLYDGAYAVHGRRIPFQVLYLHSRATQESIRRAHKEAFREHETQVVYAPSLSRRVRVHEELLRKKAERFVTLPEYLASFVQQELKPYTDHLKTREPKYYVEPKISTPAGVKRRFPNPLENFLEDPTADESGDGHVAVVLAEPGQGKTFMCDYLVSRLAIKSAAQSRVARFAPIYINAEQWKSMDEADLSSLEKTMTHCFRYFESPIGWLDGNEEQFLRTTLRAGLFRVVFDGFDEYVLRSHGRIDALEALHRLIALARATGTRIIITARTTFWDSEIEGRADELPDASESLFVYKIDPFEYSQAVHYFNKRLLEGSPASSRAAALYKTLSHGGDQFVGRGFVLSLIADLYERDPNFEARDIVGGPVTWLLHALCEREQLRQALPLDADQQMSVLTQCSVEEALGKSPSDEEVSLYIQMEGAKLDEEAARICRSKLASHPLITRDSATCWRITQGQAKVALVARFLTSGTTKDSKRSLLSEFSKGAALDPGSYDDLAAMLVELNTEVPEEEARIARLKELLRYFLSCRAEGAAALPRLAFLTAIRFVDSTFRAGSLREDRTKLLCELMPRSELKGLRCSGSVSRFDFRGKTFVDCRFDAVRWANCRFDGATVFQRCNFQGGSVEYCEDFGNAQFPQCDGDEAGMGLVHSEQIAAGERTYSDADLRSDIRHVVQKFIPKGGFILKTVRRDHLRNGPIKRSRYVETVIEELTRYLLEPHHISGTSESGLHVRDDATECVRFYATNNVFTGPLEVAYRRLRQRTGI